MAGLIPGLSKSRGQFIYSPEEPQFTESQQKAMSHFFNKCLSPKVKDWNRVPASSPIWKECISTLISDYKIIDYMSSARRISKRGIEVLNRQMRLGDLKHFFCEHILTDPAQIQDKLSHFIAAMRLNQAGQYTCLVPSNSYCLVDYRLLVEDCSHPIPESVFEVFDGRQHCSSELDLLLDKTFEDEMISVDMDPKRTCTIKRSVSAKCTSFVALTGSKVGIKESIEDSVNRVFSEKIEEISTYEYRKTIVRIALAAVAAAGVILYIRRSWFRK